MNDVLGALGALDRQLYLGIVDARNPLLAVLAIALTYLNYNGLIWWVGIVALARARGIGRRGIASAATVVLGLADAWIVAELLKFVFARPRPFNVVGIPEGGTPVQLLTVIPQPTSFSFPSGDAALAFGAAVALGIVSPRLRWPALLFAAAIALSRVVVGAHYPGDVLAGALLGSLSGLVAPHAVALVRRRFHWRAFVVPHTHWDREWYERFEGYRARLVPMISRLLDVLESDPEFRSFTFDGQTIPIQDHLEKRPEDRPRIEALVRADRLLIGPWHVLADLLLVSGESIIRNLQEGLRVSGEIGRAARVAYVADPFGHPAQIPQILRGFGYDTYVFARGMGDEGEDVGSEFLWEAVVGAEHGFDDVRGFPCAYPKALVFQGVAGMFGQSSPFDEQSLVGAVGNHDAVELRAGGSRAACRASGTHDGRPPRPVRERRCAPLHGGRRSRRGIPAAARSGACDASRASERRDAHRQPRGVRRGDAGRPQCRDR